MVQYSNALGLDVGSKRIGVARVNSIARIPEPLLTLPMDEHIYDAVKKLIHATA